MKKILLVANQTLGCPELETALTEYEATGVTEVHVLAPTTRTEGEHQWDYPPTDRYIPTPTEIAHALAGVRLEKELKRLRAVGVQATGEIADSDPVGHVVDHVAADPPDEVVVCTLPARVSHWLRMDLPQRLHRALDVPVRHIEGTAGPSL